MGENKKFRLVGFIFKSLLTIVIALLAFAVLAYFLILPSLVKGLAETEAQNYVDGTVTIQTVNLNLLGTSTIGKITVRDQDEKTWMYIDSIDVSVEDLLTLAPVVKRIDINNPVFTAHNAAGEKLPFKAPPQKAKPQYEIPPEKLPQVFVNNASVEIPIKKLNSKEIVDNISAIVKFRPDGSGPEFSVVRTGTNGNISTIEGHVNPETLLADIRVSIKHDLKEDKFSSLIKAQEVPEITGADGVIFGDMQITGTLDKPQTIQITGDLNARDIILKSQTQNINSDMDVSVTFAGRRARITRAEVITEVAEISSGIIDLAYDDTGKQYDVKIAGAKINFPPDPYSPYWKNKLKDNHLSGYINLQGTASIFTGEKTRVAESITGRAWFERITLQLENPLLIQKAVMEDFRSINGKFNCEKVSAKTCGGNVNGKISHDRNSAASHGIFDFDSLNVAQLSRALNRENKFTKGKARGNITFETRDLSHENLKMDIILAVDNGDLETNPIAAEIFRLTQVNPLRIGGLNDIYTELNIDYPTLTINKARVANDLAAIDAEPGGTVDLDRRYIDMYVVVGNFSTLGGIIPTSTTDFAKRLTRIGVRGNLSDPPSSLLHKEPLGDISTGVIDFFRQSMQSPETLTRDIMDIVDDPKIILKKLPTSLPQEVLNWPKFPQLPRKEDSGRE